MFDWRNSPFVRLVIPLMVGIIIGLYCKTEASLSTFLFSLPILLFFSIKERVFRALPVYAIILNLGLVFFGILLIQLRTEKYCKNHYTNCLYDSVLKKGIVISQPVEKEKTHQLELEIAAMFVGGNWKSTKGKAIVYLQKGGRLPEIGDAIVFASNLKIVAPPGNPKQFSYKRYLECQNIYTQGYIPKDEYTLHKNYGFNLIKWSRELRAYLQKVLEDANLGKEGYSVSSALLLGAKGELDNELRNAYSNAGTMHVLAVSGLHVGIIYLIFNFLFSLIRDGWGRWIKAVLLLGVLWGYALITGLGPSVVRSATMFSFIVVGGALERRTNIYNTLAASAFLLLVIDPYYIVQVGFQLSYLAVLGIVYFQPIIYKWFYSRWWLLDKIWSLTAVSLAAQLVTFPLGLFYFHQFPAYFLVSNLLVVPLAMVILLLGLLLFVTSPLEWLLELVAFGLKWCLILLNEGVKWLDQLPMAVVKGIHISLLECLGIYLLIALVSVAFNTRQIRWLNYGFVISIGLLGWSHIEKHRMTEKSRLVVGDINGHTCINLIHANNNIVLADDQLIIGTEKLFRSLGNYWDYLNLKTPEIVSLNQIQQKDLVFLFHGQKIMVLNQKLNSITNDIEVDLLIVTKDCKMNPVELLKWVKAERVILDSSMSFSQIQKWQKISAKSHVVRQKGAFELILG